MTRLALIAAAGLALVGCGETHHTPPATSHRSQYPSTTPFPPVMATERISLHDGAELVSPRRLAIVTTGSSSCPSVPDELVVLSRHVVRIHLTTGSWVNRKPVAHPPRNGICTADLGTTPMVVAIDPKEIDVYHPLTVRLFYRDAKEPLVHIAAPLTAS